MHPAKQHLTEVCDTLTRIVADGVRGELLPKTPAMALIDRILDTRNAIKQSPQPPTAKQPTATKQPTTRQP